MATGASGSTIYAAGSDDRLKALEEDGSVGLKVAADIDAGCAIFQIALPAGKLSGGTLPNFSGQIVSRMKATCHQGKFYISNAGRQRDVAG